MKQLIITADDYGYSRRYDRGIVEAAARGGLDAVSSFAERAGVDPAPLLDSGVEIGLHLELDAAVDAPRAGPAERQHAAQRIESQLSAFEALYGRPPAYLDGHHHAHAREGLGVLVCDIAAAAGLPVRSISPRHRRLLRCRGVATADLLVGRLNQREPALPAELTPEGSAGLRDGTVIEWMVHPGYPDPESGSGYDAGRLQDLALLLGWRVPAGLERTSHTRAAARTTPSS